MQRLQQGSHVRAGSLGEYDPVPLSSQKLKFTGGNFSWTFLQVGNTTLGIIGNLQSMVEACINLFPSQISEFVDPILKLLQDDYVSEIQLRHSTSKNFAIYFI
ncbi:unnamed protein product [Vicia faba]|uniref:Uncharacterized protein n=1 Tax=Vicia faba TaxID=3906 RepID=A0AAV1AH08_VICFA|nr:unnamed protein product [Vicia faba]